MEFLNYYNLYARLKQFFMRLPYGRNFYFCPQYSSFVLATVISAGVAIAIETKINCFLIVNGYFF